MKVQSLRSRIKEVTANAILDAAEQVAAEEGLSASLGAVAERAGVAVGTIYNYFRDRDELFRELFARRRAEIFTAVDLEMKRVARASFREQLSAFVGALLAQFDERRVFLRIALEADHCRPSMAPDEAARAWHAMRQVQKVAARVIRIGQREGVLRPCEGDIYPAILTGILRGILVARIDDPRPFAADAERVVSLFLHGAST